MKSFAEECPDHIGVLNNHFCFRLNEGKTGCGKPVDGRPQWPAEERGMEMWVYLRALVR